MLNDRNSTKKGTDMTEKLVSYRDLKLRSPLWVLLYIETVL